MNYAKRDYCRICGAPATNAVFDSQGKRRFIYCKSCAHNIKFPAGTPLVPKKKEHEILDIEPDSVERDEYNTAIPGRTFFS